MSRPSLTASQILVDAGTCVHLRVDGLRCGERSVAVVVVDIAASVGGDAAVVASVAGLISKNQRSSTAPGCLVPNTHAV